MKIALLRHLRCEKQTNPLCRNPDSLVNVGDSKAANQVSRFFTTFAKLTDKDRGVNTVYLQCSKLKRATATTAFVTKHLVEKGIEVVPNDPNKNLNEWGLGKVKSMTLAEAHRSCPGYPFRCSYDDIPDAEKVDDLLIRVESVATELVSNAQSKNYSENEAVVICSHGNFILWLFSLVHCEMDKEKAKALYAHIMEKRYTLPNLQGIILDVKKNCEFLQILKVQKGLNQLTAKL